MKTIAETLICSSSVPSKERDCTNCQYRWLEPVDSHFPCPTDVIIDGIEYWESCNCDQICKDAAEELNKLTDLKQTIQQIHDKVYQEAYQKGYENGLKESAK